MGFIPSQVQDFALPFVELHEMPVGPFLLPFKVPFNSKSTIWCSSHSSQFCIFCKFADNSLCPPPLSLVKILNGPRSSINLWGTPLVTCFQLEFKDHNPLGWQFSQLSVTSLAIYSAST